MGSKYHQISRNEKEMKKKNEKTSRNECLQQKSHQSDKYLGSSPSNILRTIPKMDKRETQTNEPKGKEIDDNA